MLTSLAYIFLAGLAMAGICQQLKIPRIIGMLAVGILLGPSQEKRQSKNFNTVFWQACWQNGCGLPGKSRSKSNWNE